MIIDFHTHYYPAKVVGKALAAVEGRIGHYTDGSRAGLLASMREAKIDYSLALPIATRPANSRGINTWAAAERSENIGLTGSIHPGDPYLPDTLKYIAEQGLPGIKLHPEYQQFDFADERLYPVWKRCVELDLFVITHAGCDVMFKPPWHSDPARLAAFHRRFPELKLILAHLGSMEMWDAVETELAGLPVYFDLALLTPDRLPPQRLLAIIRKHGAERILFGTDSPWSPQKAHVDYIRSLPLSEAERELIFHRNAAKLLHL